jgi:hypothetical protein
MSIDFSCELVLTIADSRSIFSSLRSFSPDHHIPPWSFFRNVRPDEKELPRLILNLEVMIIQKNFTRWKDFISHCISMSRDEDNRYIMDHCLSISTSLLMSDHLTSDLLHRLLMWNANLVPSLKLVLLFFTQRNDSVQLFPELLGFQNAEHPNVALIESASGLIIVYKPMIPLSTWQMRSRPTNTSNHRNRNRNRNLHKTCLDYSRGDFKNLKTSSLLTFIPKPRLSLPHSVSRVNSTLSSLSTEFSLVTDIDKLNTLVSNTVDLKTLYCAPKDASLSQPHKQQLRSCLNKAKQTLSNLSKHLRSLNSQPCITKYLRPNANSDPNTIDGKEPGD